MKNDWFASWFDTKYYHTLYKHRDEKEAKTFIGKLIENLKIPKGKKVLDLACGKGRHSITLNELGYNVTGADLSTNSIAIASKSSKSGLNFIVHDMREPIQNTCFSAVFNLFTSFGYFDKETDNIKVLESIHEMLEEKGLLIIDFMNISHAIKQLIPDDIKTLDGIEFKISKKYDGKHIFKEIKFEDNGEYFHFTEKVQALTLEIFENLLSKTGFKILRTFGDIDLNPFDKINSDRLIIIAQKI